MKKIWINRANSFKEAGEFDEKYYSDMSASQRLDILQYLRDIFHKFHKLKNHESRKRLRRSVKVIKQT